MQRRGGVPERRTCRMICDLVVFMIGFHKLRESSVVHRPYFHIDADIGKIGLHHLHQLDVTANIGHDIGFKAVRITGRGQQLFCFCGIVGILFFQRLRPLFIRETEPGHISGGHCGWIWVDCPFIVRFRNTGQIDR